MLERVFPGTDHEMATVYHLDGEDLVLTHYCVRGNQPRMKARPGAPPGEIVFECVGGTNIESEDDVHMHQGTITPLGPDRLRTEWLQTEKGKVTFTARFDLARRKG